MFMAHTYHTQAIAEAIITRSNSTAAQLVPIMMFNHGEIQSSGGEADVASETEMLFHCICKHYIKRLET